MNFAEAQDYLLSLGNEVEAMKLGLDNIRKLLNALGDPQKEYLKVQVAGTNGKGSVCAFLNSICLEAGIKTGTYTSPHLITVTERVQINGVDISEEEFARFATCIRGISERLVADKALGHIPTFFEQVTAIALLAFAEGNVELAILETGLGGRFDAVTAANAEIAAITRIDYDHQKQLGETIEEIAFEKAAIIRNNSKVVIGEQQSEALKVIRDRCDEMGVTPFSARDLLAEKSRNSTGGEFVSFRLDTERSRPLVFPPVCLGLLGEHQIENAKIAIVLAEVLKERFQITSENILNGLANARHPGRLEWIGNVLLDGAHNVGGANALRTYLEEFVAQPITLIFGAMQDKNVSEIAGVLFPRAKEIILTRPNNSRALTAQELAASVPAEIDQERIFLTNTFQEALSKAQSVGVANSVILITGSLYLVGEARNTLLSST